MLLMERYNWIAFQPPLPFNIFSHFQQVLTQYRLIEHDTAYEEFPIKLKLGRAQKCCRPVWKASSPKKSPHEEH